MNGNRDIVIFLVEKGIDILIKNSFNKTAGEDACDKGLMEIADYLIDKEIILSNDSKNVEIIEDDCKNLDDDEDGENVEMKITEKDLEDI